MRTVLKILAALGGLVVIAVLVVVSAGLLFDRQARKDARDLFAGQKITKTGVITEADIAGLPEPVQRWLRYSKVIGKERVHAVRLKQEGTIRTAEGQPWMPFTAEQYYTADSPGFVWKANVRFASFIPMSGQDMYSAGKGHMLIKLLNLVSVADATGKEMDQGAMVRYLSEIIWFPSAAVSDFIKWEPIDASSAKATMSYQGMTVSGIFHFDEKGALTDFTADRYRDAGGGKFELGKWEAPATAYGEFNGVRIPVTGEAKWLLLSGDLPYIRLTVTEVQYNVSEVY